MGIERFIDLLGWGVDL